MSTTESAPAAVLAAPSTSSSVVAAPQAQVTPLFAVTPSTPASEHDTGSASEDKSGWMSPSPIPKTFLPIVSDTEKQGERSSVQSGERGRNGMSRRGPSLSELAAALRLHERKEQSPPPATSASSIHSTSSEPTSSSSPERTTTDRSTDPSPRSRLAATLNNATLLRSTSQPTLPSQARRPSAPSLDVLTARIKARRGSATGVSDEKEKHEESNAHLADAVAEKVETEGKEAPVAVEQKREPEVTEKVKEEFNPALPAAEKPSMAAGSYFPPVTTSSPPRPAQSSAPRPSSSKHPLQHPWTFFYHAAPPVNSSSPVPSPSANQGASFKANLKRIGTALSVEDFASLFNYLKRPSQMDPGASLYVFKDGLLPLWELPGNAAGGKWTLTLSCLPEKGVGAGRPENVDRCWTYLVLGLIGEELDGSDQLCGAVLTRRGRQTTRIQLWTRSLHPVESLNNLGSRLLRLLELGNMEGVTFSFAPHNLKALDSGPKPFGNSSSSSKTYLKINNPIISNPPTSSSSDGQTQNQNQTPLSAPGQGQAWRQGPMVTGIQGGVIKGPVPGLQRASSGVVGKVSKW